MTLPEVFRTLVLTQRKACDKEQFILENRETLLKHSAGRQKSWLRSEVSSGGEGRQEGICLLLCHCAAI